MALIVFMKSQLHSCGMYHITSDEMGFLDELHPKSKDGAGQFRDNGA
jgi:hypothetical protein